MNWKKKLALGLVHPLLEFRVRLPLWVVIYVVLLPVIAYGDVVMFGKHDFWGYVGVSSVEIFLVYLGFSIAYYTKLIEGGE